MNAKNYFYARCSSTSQNTECQILAAKQRGMEFDEVFNEKVSGKNLERKELQRMLSLCEEGTAVVVYHCWRKNIRSMRSSPTGGAPSLRIERSDDGQQVLPRDDFFHAGEELLAADGFFLSANSAWKKLNWWVTPVTLANG